MASTLTLVGILLVRFRDTLDKPRRTDRLRRRLDRVTALLPVLTAALVLIVGVGLAARAAGGLG